MSTSFAAAMGKGFEFGASASCVDEEGRWWGECETTARTNLVVVAEIPSVLSID